MVSPGKVSCIVFVMHVEYLLLRVMCVLMHVHEKSYNDTLH